MATGWTLDLTNPLDPTIVVEGQTLKHIDRVSVDWRPGQVARLFVEATSPGVLDGLGPVIQMGDNLREKLDQIDPEDLEKQVRESGSMGDSLGALFLNAIKARLDG